MVFRLPKRGEDPEREVTPGPGARLPKGVQVADMKTAHTILDTPVAELAKRFMPDKAGMIPADKANVPLRVILQTSNFVTKGMIMSYLGPHLEKAGVTAAEINKAASEPSPAPEPPRPKLSVAPAAAKQYNLPPAAPPPAAPPPAAAQPPATAAAPAAPPVAAPVPVAAPAPAAAAPPAVAAPPPVATGGGGANLGHAAHASRGHVKTEGVSPALVAAIRRVGDTYGPYEVRITSGLRPGKHESFHGKGQAIDVALFDRKTGEKLPNYQNAKNVAEYQNLANAIYADAQKNDPALANRLRWGGYFGNDAATGKPKYGSLDLMHFDEGGHVGMRGGSWKEGFTPEMQKYWKIPALAVAGAPAAAGPTYAEDPMAPGTPDVRRAETTKDPNAIQRAFLKTLSRGEIGRASCRERVSECV